MNPKISIIVPVYKVEKYLERCVSSLLGQTLQEIEILLIDDASPDRSPKMCDAFRKKDERITVIHKPVNQGLALARNTGIEHARGKYLLFVDSDDFVETEMCRKLYEKAEETGADTVLFSVNYIMGNGKVIDYHTNDGKEEIFKGNEVMEKYFPEVLGAEPSRKTDYNFGMHPGSILLKKSVLTENNIRFISERTYIYEDMTFLFLYYPHVKKVLVYPEIFYHYCMNEGSLTTTVDVNRFERVKKMHGYLMEQYGSNLLKKENLRLRYQRIMLSYIRLCVMQLPLSLEGYRKVRMIGRSDFTKDVFRDYPIRKLPLKQRIFAYLLKYRLSFANLLLTAVYQESEIREKSKNMDYSKNSQLVSVIIPAYNVGKFFEKCVKSVIEQSYRNLEILIVDDGSLDNTGKIADRLAGTDDRIKVIHKENAGVSAARNTGIDAAGGEYIIFLDADDFLAEDFVSYMLSLVQQTGAEFCLSKNCHMTTAQAQEPECVETLSGEDAAVLLLSLDVAVGCWNKIFSREFLIRENIRFSTELFYGEGLNFIITASQKANCVGAGTRRVYFYRKDNETSATTVFNIKKYYNGEKALNVIRENFVTDSPKIVRAWERHLWLFKIDGVSEILRNGAAKEYPKEYKEWKRYIIKNFHRNISAAKLPYKLKLRICCLCIFPWILNLWYGMKKLKRR